MPELLDLAVVGSAMPAGLDKHVSPRVHMAPPCRLIVWPASEPWRCRRPVLVAGAQSLNGSLLADDLLGEHAGDFGLEVESCFGPKPLGMVHCPSGRFFANPAVVVVAEHGAPLIDEAGTGQDDAQEGAAVLA